MATRARATSDVENQGEAASLAAKRVVAPMRAAFGNININTRHGSQSEKTSKDVLKPSNLISRPQKENNAPAPKKTENEAERMEMSAVVEVNNVVNIDAEDVGNPQLVTDYVNEIYSYLRVMENKQDIRADYLAGQTEILPKMRAVLVDWMVGVHLQFHMLQETLFSTVAILDRYLQKEIASVSRKKLQLVGVACMLIAAKYEEIYAPEIKDFVYITDHAYSEREIQKMEVHVLSVLKFDLGRPLPLHFLRRASKAGGVDSATHTLAKYICELGLGVYSLAHIAPSKLSAAALALAIRLVEPSISFPSLWSPALVHYTKYTVEDLGAVITPLAEVLFLAPSAKLGTVYSKFCNKKFMKISRIPLLDDPILRKIAKGEKCPISKRRLVRMSAQGVHGSLCEDVELLQQLVTQELAERGIPLVVATPRNTKRALTPFSTPAHKGETPKARGKVFGKRLGELTQRAVSVPNLEADLMVPKFVDSACTYIEDRKEVEGIYRMSGSQGRQRVIRAHIEEQQTDFASISPLPHVLDVASLLKQFLRELPEPVIPRSLHTLLSSCYLSTRPLENLQLALLLLPPSHSATLTFLLCHLNAIAEASGDNKMGAANLAIVLSPNLLPSQEAQLKGKKAHQVDVNSAKLKQHTAILELLIQNSDGMGFLSEEIEERYQTCLSMPSYQSQSEGELLDEETSCGAARRKVTKKKHIRRRSGSLSRVLSVMGKAMGLGRTPGTTKGVELSSVHSTPLPAFGGTPAFPSPRGRETTSKRNNDGEHDLSPTKKVQRRTLETTFTPKMRKRSFSVKRFKRKKSEGKMKPLMKETLIIHASESVKAEDQGSCSKSPRVTRASVNGTPQQQRRPDVVDNDNLEPDYDEVKAQYVELVEEVARLEAEQGPTAVEAMFEEVSKTEERMGRSRERENQVARARRRSSEDHRKPRSPSQRRIGALRRRSREKEERQAREERGRSPGPRRSLETRAAPRRSLEPVCKPALTPLHHRPSLRAERLQRGRPNATSVGLEKPLASPSHGSGEDGKGRIKMSFKGRERPSVIRKEGPVRATQSPLGRGLNHDQSSLVSLKNDISDLIEKSFGSGQEQGTDDMEADTVVDTAVIFAVEDSNVDMVDSSFTNTLTNSEMVEMFGNISVKSGSSVVEGEKSPKEEEVGTNELFKQSSPVTRSQLRRQSLSFQFTRPADVDQGGKEGNLRRQSSAFEFRSSEPLQYGSLNRDIASRASLRRRNSSVKDLIQRLEGSTMGNTNFVGNTAVGDCNVFTKPEQPDRKDVVYENMAFGPKKKVDGNERKFVAEENVTARACPLPDLRPERPRPVLNPEPLLLPETETAAESWVDGATFFHNLKELNAPQCGRSSIVKIRKENRGRVQDTASKFSTSLTPARPSQDVPGRTSRRQSARLGVAGTPARLGCLPPAANRLGAPSPMRTPLGLPSGRRSTLTGIRTAARGYAAPTIASSARVSEKSPRAETLSVVQEKVKKSPAVVVTKSRRSPPGKPHVYENVRMERAWHVNENKSQPLERKVSNPSERKRGQLIERKGSNAKPAVERKVSNPKPSVERKSSNPRDLGKTFSNNPKGNRAKVKRNKSTQEKNARRQAKSERRYLTIGCPQEVTHTENRDPLRERQNLVQRSASDQTPGGQTKALRKRLQSEDQENLVAPALVIARKHSLRSDALMSPHKRVKRVHSDRSPRAMAGRHDVLVGDTPRRSPRLN